MATSDTAICNQALARIGAKRITDLATGQTIEAQKCRDLYEQERDALLEAHGWHFAEESAVLSEDTVTPAFGYTHQYILPSDCLRVLQVHCNAIYTVQGDRLLTNHDSCKIIYVQKVTDPTKFHPMFTKALALALAMQLAMPLAQDKQLRQIIQGEYENALARAKVVNDQAEQTDRRLNWRSARYVNIAKGGGGR